MDSAVSAKRNFQTRYTRDGFFYLSAAGRDSVFVCGLGVYSRHSTLTHYNLTEEERCTVLLGYWTYGMTTVLCDNRSCIALSDW